MIRLVHVYNYESNLLCRWQGRDLQNNMCNGGQVISIRRAEVLLISRAIVIANERRVNSLCLLGDIWEGRFSAHDQYLRDPF